MFCQSNLNVLFARRHINEKYITQLLIVVFDLAWLQLHRLLIIFVCARACRFAGGVGSGASLWRVVCCFYASSLDFQVRRADSDQYLVGRVLPVAAPTLRHVVELPTHSESDIRSEKLLMRHATSARMWCWVCHEQSDHDCVRLYCHIYWYKTRHCLTDTYLWSPTPIEYAYR